MSSMVQLNVRMRPELKARGDSVLELYGVSPSELVRALWEKISLGGEAFAQVVEALAANPAAGSSKTIVRMSPATSIASEIRQRQADFENELGLDSSTYRPLDADELEDLVYQDYLEERQTSHAG